MDNFIPYLITLSRDVSSDEFKIMVDFTDSLNPPVRKGEREKLKKPYDLFAKLKEINHLSKTKSDVLVRLLEAANRPALAFEVKARFRLGFHREVSDEELEKATNEESEKTTLGIQRQEADHNQNQPVGKLRTDKASTPVQGSATPSNQPRKRPLSDQRQAAHPPVEPIVQTQEEHKEIVPTSINSNKSILFVGSSVSSSEFDRVRNTDLLLSSATARKGITTYITTFDAKNEEFSRDDETGVIAVNPKKMKLDSREDKNPSLDWLTTHESMYPLQLIENVGGVVGHITGKDHIAAIGAKLIKDDIAPQGKLLFINHVIPEDDGDTEMENSALEKAEKADFVFSVGPEVYLHFKTKYKGSQMENLHECYYPSLNKTFSDSDDLSCPGKEFEYYVLSVVDVNSAEDYPKYTLAAMSLGKAAHTAFGYAKVKMKWDVYGVPPSRVKDEFNKFLNEKAHSRNLVINTYPPISLTKFRQKMATAAFLLAPEKRDPFNFPAFFALQAGFPVLVPNSSGIHEFIGDLFPKDDYKSYISLPTARNNHEENLRDDCSKWEEKITARMNPTEQETAFSMATKIKHGLKSHCLFKQSEEAFISQCSIALSGTGEPMDTTDSANLPIVSQSAVDTTVTESTGYYSSDSTSSTDLSVPSSMEGNESGIVLEAAQKPVQRSKRWRDQLDGLRALDDAACEWIEGVKICTQREEFTIAPGCEGTQVFLGLNDQDEEFAVKKVLQNLKMKNAINQEVDVLKDPNLKKEKSTDCYNVVEDNQKGFVYMILELCEKKLDEHVNDLKSTGELENQCKTLITDMLKGIQALHNNERKVVHRDLKPENILISCNGRAKVADFGISRILDPGCGTYMTKDGAGSTGWQSRESLIQSKSCIHVSRRSDIQVAGMLVAYIASGGHHPFEGESVYFTPANICSGKSDLSEIQDPLIKHLVTWMIQKERLDRPSIDEVLSHPYFWEKRRYFEFLVAVAAEFQVQTSDVLCEKLKQELDSTECRNWKDKFLNEPYSDVVNRHEDGFSGLMDLIKFCDCEDMNVDPSTEVVGKLQDVFLKIYDVMLQSKKAEGDGNWTQRHRLTQFFTVDVV